MYRDKKTKKIYKDREPYTAPDGTQYPGNYPKGAIEHLEYVRDDGMRPAKGQRFKAKFVAEDENGEPFVEYQYEDIPAFDLWKEKMAETDSLPRHVEDLIDVLKSKGLIDDSDLPETLRVNYATKKELRSKKPT